MAFVARSIREAVDQVSDSITPAWLGGSRTDMQRAAPAPTRPSILPKNYLVEFIAGTFGPASSGRGLTDHLVTEQNLRRVVNRTNLGVIAAQDLEENARRKLEEIQLTRAAKFKRTIERLVDHLESSCRRAEDRPAVIREIFSLDDSPTAQVLSREMAESHYLERLHDESFEIRIGRLAGLNAATAVDAFVGIEGRYRTELASFLPEFDVDLEGERHLLSDDKALKIINRIFDAFAPRMILIGHSQGGLVALRAMQLGMRRVRVKDKRRFLYSPRSGRVHRYSPVALAVGLGAPFDGIAERPSDFSRHGPERIDAHRLPRWVERFMPGVGQMLNGSAFLKAMRGAFIPFDCSALSIANPLDGLVPLAQTRLPVGDFQNMHNLDVESSGRFDVADIAPPAFRRALDLWPMSSFRSMMNDSARFEGLRQHCSFLVDLDENWDVDRGEIVQQIFAGESGEGLFDEMMFEVNFDGLREQLMANLLYRLRTANEGERAHLAWMQPRLEHMIREETLPFLNSIDKRARLALDYIAPQ